MTLRQTIVPALVLVLLGLAIAATAPALAGSLVRGRVAAAGRLVTTDLARLRSAAITTGRVQGLKMTRTGETWSYEFFEDGDGDGLRSDDIAAVRDRRTGGPVRLAEHFEGVDFGLDSTKALPNLLVFLGPCSSGCRSRVPRRGPPSIPRGAS